MHHFHCSVSKNTQINQNPSFIFLTLLTLQIPDIAAFWILTSFVRLPIQCYLILAEHTTIRTVPLVVQTTAMIFIILQLFIGFFVIRSFSKNRAKQFRLETLIKQQNNSSSMPVTIS